MWYMEDVMKEYKDRVIESVTTAKPCYDLLRNMD